MVLTGSSCRLSKHCGDGGDSAQSQHSRAAPAAASPWGSVPQTDRWGAVRGGVSQLCPSCASSGCGLSPKALSSAGHKRIGRVPGRCGPGRARGWPWAGWDNSGDRASYRMSPLLGRPLLPALKTAAAGEGPDGFLNLSWPVEIESKPLPPPPTPTSGCLSSCLCPTWCAPSLYSPRSHQGRA